MQIQKTVEYGVNAKASLKGEELRATVTIVAPYLGGKTSSYTVETKEIPEELLKVVEAALKKIVDHVVSNEKNVSVASALAHEATMVSINKGEA